jgi:hypothetical protein
MNGAGLKLNAMRDSSEFDSIRSLQHANTSATSGSARLVARRRHRVRNTNNAHRLSLGFRRPAIWTKIDTWLTGLYRASPRGSRAQLGFLPYRDCSRRAYFGSWQEKGGLLFLQDSLRRREFRTRGPVP